jgi:hypothetical protein
MNKSVARSLAILIIAMISFVTVSAMLSTDASAASVSGTWVSRVAGQGYVQRYMGLSGNTVTDSFDVELVLSGAGSSITGTMTTIENGVPRTHAAEGSFDGTIFLMTVDLGWDGVNWLTPLYTLTVSGNEMSGSGSYLNAGVTIYCTFDLKKEGVFGGLEVAGGMAPAISALVIIISIVAIVIASTPVKIPPAPQGFQPQVMSVPSPQYSYQPSVQTETSSSPIGPPEPGTSMGGAGISYGTSTPAGGRPLAPRDHFSKTSQEPPRCPHHPYFALVPHYFKTDGSDPGSWFCPKCNGYPWGRN